MNHLFRRAAQLALVTALPFAIAACGGDVADNVQKAETQDAVQTQTPVEEIETGTPAPSKPEGIEFTVDTDRSVVNFTGEKILGDPHIGGWSKWSGLIIVPESDFAGAYIEIEFDMSSTFSDDADLTKKLVGEEFFEVALYPTASFASTSIEGADGTYTVTGNFTLHGITMSLSFEADVELRESSLTAESEFSFNRKDFGVDYDGLADNIILDDVVIGFLIEAGINKE